MKETLSQIGFISKLSGFKGEVMLILENITFDSLLKAKFLFIELNGIPVPFAVEEIKEKSGNAVVKFEDVNDVDYARRLVNNQVLIVSKRKKKTVKEASWMDMVGYEIIDPEYGSLGKIQKIEEYPQQMIATCNVNGKDVLIPLSEHLIKEINDEERKIYLELPEGLLDIYLK